MDRLFQVSTHLFLGLAAGILVFTAYLLTGDLYRLLAGLYFWISQGHFFLPDRHLYWIFGGYLLLIGVLFIYIHGIRRGKYAYQIIQHRLYFEDLPEAFHGFKIVQISDVHAGSFTNARAVQKGIDLINQQKADLFVFTGDLVNHRAEEITPWIPYFHQIKAPYGQFSILGNHDYGDYVRWPDDLAKRANLQQLKKHHESIGFRLLLDEHVEIQQEDQSIYLAGVENWGLGFGERGDLDKALKGVAPHAFTVLLSHDPSHWEKKIRQHPSQIHLTLSGHTHGMQFGIEAFGLKWSPVQYRYPHWAGMKSENGRYLHVNRGFGFIGFSGRIGIWPEITVIELFRKTT